MRATIDGVFLEKGNSRSVFFGGKYINILAIARTQNLDQSFVSQILRGNKAPSIATAIKISAALGMTVDEFIAAIEERKMELNLRAIEIHDKFTERIIREDTEDIRALKSGLPPKPRLPGTSRP